MNLFYKLGVLVAIIVTTLTGSAQSRSYRIFDEFANHDGLTYMAFSKSMIDAVDLKLDEGDSKRVQECHVIVKDSKDNQFSCLVSFYGNFKVEDLDNFEKFSRKQAEE